MEPSPGLLTKTDYVALASFRYALRRFLRTSEEVARTEGLTTQQYQLLLAIKGQPQQECASITELAEALLIRHHSTVELVQRCVALGLVQRTVQLEDRRRAEITLTERGEFALARVAQRSQNELEVLRSVILVPSRE